ncbi:MAG: hypothetical protein AAF978_07230 [Cyanobacteria bacterium P01_E01_bin.48]
MTAIRSDLLGPVADILQSIAGASGIAPCTVYLVRHTTTNSPGQPASTTFEPVLKTPAIDLKQKSSRGNRDKAGIEAAEVYVCQIAMPTRAQILS